MYFVRYPILNAHIFSAKNKDKYKIFLFAREKNRSRGCSECEAPLARVAILQARSGYSRTGYSSHICM